MPKVKGKEKEKTNKLYRGHGQGPEAEKTFSGSQLRYPKYPACHWLNMFNSENYFQDQGWHYSPHLGSVFCQWTLRGCSSTEGLRAEWMLGFSPEPGLLGMLM